MGLCDAGQGHYKSYRFDARCNTFMHTTKHTMMLGFSLIYALPSVHVSYQVFLDPVAVWCMHA